MDRLAQGYMLAEAPVAAPGGGLFFSDALGGGVYRWSPDAEGVETVVPKKRGIGGMALHADGGLVVSGRNVSHIRPDGETHVLFADEGITGVNDITVDPEGRVIAGVLRFHPFKGEEPVPGEFVRVGGDGSAATVLPDVLWVNGCAFSPEEKTFYGADFHRGVVFAADRGEDGTYGPPRAVVESPSGDVDGVAVDEDGAIWVALGSRRSVGRFRPDGELDLEIDVPAFFVSSLCFGGPQRRDLFITTAADPEDPEALGAVFVTPAPAAGVTVPPVV